MKGDPVKLLAKLSRCADALRWWLWLERHSGSVLWVDGEVTVTASDPWQYGRGKTLAEAMRMIEVEAAEEAKLKRQREAFAKQYGGQV